MANRYKDKREKCLFPIWRMSFYLFVGLTLFLFYCYVDPHFDRKKTILKICKILLKSLLILETLFLTMKWTYELIWKWFGIHMGIYWCKNIISNVRINFRRELSGCLSMKRKHMTGKRSLEIDTILWCNMRELWISLNNSLQ